MRDKIKFGLEAQIWDFFDRQGGQVVIYDANNGSREARKEVMDEFGSKGVHVIFLGECRGRAGLRSHPIPLACRLAYEHFADNRIAM